MAHLVHKVRSTTHEIAGDAIVEIEFSSKSIANLFMQTALASSLLNSFSPNSDGIWELKQRTPFTISGWPRGLIWFRLDEKKVYAEAELSELGGEQIFRDALEHGLKNMDSIDPVSGAKISKFTITDGIECFDYQFNKRGRSIAALCVLFDTAPHPRAHLEMNISKKYCSGRNWPTQMGGDEIFRLYGDPSKAADELSNEGWSRFGDSPGISVYKENVYGQPQQVYQLLSRTQNIQTQVTRSNIKPAWRKSLFEKQHYVCQICLGDFSGTPELLEPDHRVPVKVEADQLSETNYLTKLMTLCRNCNQQKREVTKRLDAQYNWQTSPWAFPDLGRKQLILENIKALISSSNLSKREAIEMIDEAFND